MLAPLVTAVGGGGIEPAGEPNLAEVDLPAEIDLDVLPVLVVDARAGPGGVEVAVERQIGVGVVGVAGADVGTVDIGENGLPLEWGKAGRRRLLRGARLGVWACGLTSAVR